MKFKFGSKIVKQSVLTGAVSLLCLNSFAQTSPTDTTHKLNEVKISAGGRYLQFISPVPLQILKGEELEKLNSFSVADAIRYFSGVQLKDYGGVGGLKTINVRSLGTNHVAVFYDGVEFGNSQNGQVDLGKFSLDNIQEIDLYNAQQNNIFQPAKGFSAGSSLYLATKQPVFDDGRFTGKVSLKAGSFGLVNPELSAAYKISPRVYGTISSEIIHANGRYKFTTTDYPDTTTTRHNGDIDAQRVEAAVNARLKDSSAWDLKGYLYHSNRGLPVAVVNNHFDSKQREWNRNIFFQSSYHTNQNARNGVLLNAKYSNDFTRYFNPEITNAFGLLDDKYYEHEFYVSAADRYRLTKHWDVSLSADYQRNSLDATENDTVMYRFVKPVRNTILLAAATDVHFNRLDLQASILGTFVNDTVDTLSAAGRKTEYTPALLFSWQPTENPDLRIRGFYKDIFRLPTFNDLYFTFVGNSFLRPEFTKQYDLGITYNKNYKEQALVYLSIQTDVYYNQVTDKIVAIPGQNLARWTMYNLGRVNIKGLDLNAQASWQLPKDITLNTSISYTYQKAVDVTSRNEINYNQQIPYTPLNSGSLLIDGQWKKFGFNYSFIYTGSRYDEKYNDASNYLQPWYTHDAGFTYTTNYNKHKLKLTLEVNNLLNQNYEVIQNFPMPGRNYRITLSTNI